MIRIARNSQEAVKYLAQAHYDLGRIGQGGTGKGMPGED